jgi:hypothetical protein
MELSKGTLNQGKHLLTIGSAGLEPGIYFYTVTMGAEKVTRKMIIQ